MSDKDIQALDEEPIESEPLESGPVEPASTGDPEPLASTDEGTLIKDFPLATTVNDNDDMIIETDLPQTEHCKAETFKNYVIQDALLSMYPVGAVYISTVNTSPAALFGGTWSQIQNRFLVAVGSSYTAGSTGGSATATLSSSNLPAHTHSLPSHTHSLPSHAHSLPSHTHSLPSHTHSLPSHTHSVSIPSHTHSFSATTSSSGSHSHNVGTFSNNSVGGDSRRIASLTNADDYFSTSTGGAHTHTISGTTGSYSGSVTSGSTSGTSGSTSGTSGSTSGTSGSASGTSGSASGTSGSTGSGSSFSIVPPYLAVYMWQRTA